LILKKNIYSFQKSMKKSDQTFFKDNLQSLQKQWKLYNTSSFYSEIDHILTTFQNDSKTLRQKSVSNQKNLSEKFSSLLDKIKVQFQSNLDYYFSHFDKELNNMDVLLFYYRQDLSQLKEFESNSIKFLNDFCKANDPNYFNEKNVLPDFSTLNPHVFEQKMQKLKHFLNKTSKKAEELMNFEVSLEKEFSLILNSIEIAQEKLISLSKFCSPFEDILLDLKSLSKNSSSSISVEEPQFSLKNPLSFQKKKEIPTNHTQKTHQEMFSPTDISIMKIIHFKDNFYITCGWDGRMNVTNILGKKTTMNFEAHALPIRDIIKLQQNLYVTTSDDCKTKIWHIDTEPQLITQIDTKNDKIRAMFRIGGLVEGSLILGGDLGVLKFYDLGLFKNEFNVKISDFGITSIIGLEGSDKLLIGSSKGEIIVFECFQKKILKVFNDAHNDWITSMCYQKKNDLYEICSGSYDCFLKFWTFKNSTNELTLIKKVKCDKWILKTGYFKANMIVATNGNGLVFVDIEKGNIVKKIEHVHETYVNDICFSKKDFALLSVGQDETNNIREWSD